MPPRNSPPVIVFSAVPAMLVYVDGQPVYGAVAGTSPRARHQHPAPAARRRQGTTTSTSSTAGLGARGQRPWRPARGADLAKAMKAAVGSEVDLLEGGEPTRRQADPRSPRGRSPIFVATDTGRARGDRRRAEVGPHRRHSARVRREHHRQPLQDRSDQHHLRPALRPVVRRRRSRALGSSSRQKMPADFPRSPTTAPRRT